MHEKTALIIGAGIAGAAAGIALRHIGWNAVVYEASDTPRDEAGAFLNVAPNGLNAAKALGLDGLIDGLGFQNDRLVFHNEAGRILADVAVGGVTIGRGALSRVLREAAIERGVCFVFGKALDSIEDRPGGVLARFQDGTTDEAPVLVGADGIHSRTRASYVASALKPTYTGIINLGDVTHTSLAPTGAATHMVFGRRGFFGYAVRPGGETYWFSNFAQKTEPARGSLLKLSGDEYRRRLLALHRDDPPEVRQILEAVSRDIGAYAVYDMPSLPTWRRGAVCLIGDAAHAIGPHVGQGASLAIEDALMLGKCLRDIADPVRACETFERIRRPRIDPIVKQSRRTGQQKTPAGWIGRKVRDLMLPIFLRKGADAAQQVYRYQIDWSEPIAA